MADPILATPPGLGDEEDVDVDDLVDFLNESLAQESKKTGLVGEATAVVSVEDAHGVGLKPLSAKTWEELHLSDDIMEGVRRKGFTQPSVIQATSLPMVLAGQNLIGQAQNGSGKTGAFALAMLAICKKEIPGLQGICLSPTRELCRQNYDVISDLGQKCGLKLHLAVPAAEGKGKGKGKSTATAAKIDAQILVGTPGKTADVLKKKLCDLTNFKIFVVDEADELINPQQNMGAQLMQIHGQLPKSQVVLFSATWEEDVRKLAHNLVPDATKINVKKEELSLDTITQLYKECMSFEEKCKFLGELYACMTVGQSIVFCNSRKAAEAVAQSMRAEGHAVSLISGQQKAAGQEYIDPKERDKVMDAFRAGETKVLISTDVLSRGIDVPAVTLVVNLEMPKEYAIVEGSDKGKGKGKGKKGKDGPKTAFTGQAQFATYMHRIGRTGRFGLKGFALNLINREERVLMQQIERHYQRPVGEIMDLDDLEAKLKTLR